MFIEPSALSEEALHSLISDYCTRDHGLIPTEEPVKAQHEAIERALNNKELVIVFSQSRQSAWISNSNPN